MYTINKKLLEEGKIELLKNTLNELERLSKLDADINVINHAMKGTLRDYEVIKFTGLILNSQKYDAKLSEILQGSGKEYLLVR